MGHQTETSWRQKPPALTRTPAQVQTMLKYVRVTPSSAPQRPASLLVHRISMTLSLFSSSCSRLQHTSCAAPCICSSTVCTCSIGAGSEEAQEAQGAQLLGQAQASLPDQQPQGAAAAAEAVGPTQVGMDGCHTHNRSKLRASSEAFADWIVGSTNDQSEQLFHAQGAPHQAHWQT